MVRDIRNVQAHCNDRDTMAAAIDASALTDRVSSLVEAARRAGADASDAVAIRSRSTSVSVRLGKVEGTDASETDDISLRVFLGKRVASVSAPASADPVSLAERAVAMARVSPEDPHQGLADPARLATRVVDLDLVDDVVAGEGHEGFRDGIAVRIGDCA